MNNMDLNIDPKLNSNKIISTFNISQSNSDQLCLIDPMMLLSIIFVILLLFYVICYKFNKLK